MSEKITYLKDLNIEFTDKEKTLMAFSINLLGSGEHPIAEAENIEGFAPDYTLKCVKKLVLEHDLTPAGVEIGESVIAKLEDK